MAKCRVVDLIRMDSYDLFGEDVGGSMLDGLADLGADNFDPTPSSVTGSTRDAPGSGAGYVQPTYGHQIPSLQQESPLQKLASFGGEFAPTNHLDPSSQTLFHQNQGGYDGSSRPMCPSNAVGSYPSHARTLGPQHDMRRPPHPQAPPSSQYGPYCPPDNLYSMDQQPGIGGPNMNISDSGMQGWTNTPGAYPGGIRHYNQINQGGYRHVNYPHQQDNLGQQKLAQQQQYSSNQQGIMSSMMQSHQGIPAGNYPMTQQQRMQSSVNIPQQQQQCYPQGSQSLVYPGSTTANPMTQSYTGYNPLQHQQSNRMPHHVQYPQNQPIQSQMEIGSTQNPQTSYNHLQQHNQSLPSGQSQMAHPGVPTYGQHGQPSNPMSHQIPRPIGIEVNSGSSSSQYNVGSQKQHNQALGSASPQYRAPYPQLSPQISPRPQMSPRPTPQQQMSPRPVMSPAKPSTLSPHPHNQQTTLSPRPATALTPKSSTSSPAPMAVPPFSQQSTLQQLEQMVMPPVTGNSTDYPPYQPRVSHPQSQQTAPISPALGPRMPVSPQQWPHQSLRPPPSVNGGMGLIDPQPTTQGMSPYVPHSTTESRVIEPSKTLPPSASAASHETGMSSLSNATSSSADGNSSVTPLSQTEFNTAQPQILSEKFQDSDRTQNVNSGESSNVNSNVPGPLPTQPAVKPDVEATKSVPALEADVQSAPSIDGKGTNNMLPSNPSVGHSMPSTQQDPSVPAQTPMPPNFVDYSASGGLPYQNNPGMDDMIHPGNGPHFNPAIENGPPVIPDPSSGVMMGQPPNIYDPGMGHTSMMGHGPPLPPHVIPMGHDLSSIYQTPVSHQQEMAALQQQLQELYCMPPAPQVQEKASILEL